MSHEELIEITIERAHGDFRVFLQQVLLERCRKNPSYSLRAFAKSCGMNAATISHLLRGTRPITVKAQSSISQALGLGPGEQVKFQAQPDRRMKTAMLEGVKQTKSGSTQDMTELSLEIFEAISDWIHDAILEFTRIDGFKSENAWIARKLGVTPHEVNVAVERLVKLGLLEINANGKWRSLAENSTILQDNEFTSVAARKHQAQVLELSLKALNEVSRQKRDHTSSMMTIDESDLREIKERIKKFRRELLAFAERKGAKAERLYQLNVGFFPLDKE